MPSFTCKADVSEQVAALSDIEKTQLPFVLAKTLTNVAQDGQAEVKRRARQIFKLRNTWTEQGIRVKPADKKGVDGTIQADVHTDTANRSTGAPDYLGRQDEGGEKVPVQGRQHLAVPTKYLRQMAPGVIPAELRPKNLLGATGGRFYAPRRGKSGALRSQRLVRGFEFWIQKLKGGDSAIMGRYVTDRDAYPFYLLIPEAHIRKSGLDMQVTIQKVVDERLARHWDENWRQAGIKGFRV